MTDIPDDPFDRDDMNDIYGRFHAEQINDALGDARKEIDDAVRSIIVLTERLQPLMPALAVINLVSSMAVGTAVAQVYRDG